MLCLDVLLNKSKRTVIFVLSDIKVTYRSRKFCIVVGATVFKFTKLSKKRFGKIIAIKPRTLRLDFCVTLNSIIYHQYQFNFVDKSFLSYQ